MRLLFHLAGECCGNIPSFWVPKKSCFLYYYFTLSNYLNLIGFQACDSIINLHVTNEEWILTTTQNFPNQWWAYRKLCVALVVLTGLISAVLILEKVANTTQWGIAIFQSCSQWYIISNHALGQLKASWKPKIS